jgi:glutaredoxin-related protein
MSQDTPVSNQEPASTRSNRREAPVVYESTPRAQPMESASGATSAVYEAKATNTASVTPVEERHSLKNIQAVLERFRTHKDSRSLKQFLTYFDESASKENGIVQVPAIVVSDGKSLVKVIIDLGKENESPSFSLKGANQKSLHRLTDKRWELEVLPQKGKTDVRVSVIVNGSRVEIPLTVVPPLTALGNEILTLDELKLEALAVNPLKNNKATYDLNGDGKQDYLDDYILTAHWLLKKQLKSKKNLLKPAASGK